MLKIFGQFICVYRRMDLGWTALPVLQTFQFIDNVPKVGGKEKPNRKGRYGLTIFDMAQNARHSSGGWNPF